MSRALLLRGGRGYDGAPVDVLLAGGRITAIGAPGEVEAGAAERVSLDGRFVGPGLWDAHVHLRQYVIQQRRLDLAGTANAAEVIARVRDRIAAAPPAEGETLTGYGFRDALWSDAPTLAALDAATGSTPVILISGDLHCGWFNTAAAARAGVQPDASGVLREGPWIEALADSDEASSLTDAMFAEAAATAASRGLVGVVEFENADNVTEWPARVAAGVTSLRVQASVWPDRLEEVIARGLRTGDVLDERGLVTMGPLKIVVDGSLNTRTAWLVDPYPGRDPAGAAARGIPGLDPAELRRLMRRATEAGLGLALHAIGDRAVAEVLDAYAALGVGGTLEHAQLVAPADLARFARLGVVASVQPEHAMDDRDVADRHWVGRTDRAFALASLTAAGATLRLGSDAPVAAFDPWVSIAAAVSRSRDGRAPWHPEQRVPVEAALAASARSSVATGQPADLVIVEENPLTASPETLRRMPVAATLLGGRFTWNRLGAAGPSS